jgi:hypothetical protein
MKVIPSVMKKNIAVCASGLWPTYFLGSFSMNRYQRSSKKTLLPPAFVPHRQDEELLGMVVAHEGPVDAAQKADRHDEGRREMGKADVAECELMGGFGDDHRGWGIGDQVAGDTQDGDGGGVDPVPQPHRRLVDIDRGAATDAFDIRLRRVPRQEGSGEDLDVIAGLVNRGRADRLV